MRVALFLFILVMFWHLIYMLSETCIPANLRIQLKYICEVSIKMTQQCSMCPYLVLNVTMLFTHLVRRHQKANRFIVHCNSKGRGASFRNYISFKCHVKRKHFS